jgi:hypothetical protein
MVATPGVERDPIELAVRFVPDLVVTSTAMHPGAYVGPDHTVSRPPGSPPPPGDTDDSLTSSSAYRRLCPVDAVRRGLGRPQDSRGSCSAAAATPSTKAGCPERLGAGVRRPGHRTLSVFLDSCQGVAPGRADPRVLRLRRHWPRPYRHERHGRLAARSARARTFSSRWPDLRRS